jgi:lipopolysaccharide export system protein LptA
MMTKFAMTKFRHLAPLAVLPLALALGIVGSSAAEKKASSPFQGFSSDSGKPVDVKSDSLEVHQDEQKAIFTGHVIATQGDSVLHTDELTVFYDNAAVGGGDAKKPAADKPAADATAPAPAATPAPAPAATAAPAAGADQGNSIKKLLAKGSVVVTSKDQKATGDNGVFDMAANTATLTGDEVVMIQGPNVLRGKKLVVNLKTGVSTVSGNTGGVQGIFVQQKSN